MISPFAIAFFRVWFQHFSRMARQVQRTTRNSQHQCPSRITLSRTPPGHWDWNNLPHWSRKFRSWLDVEEKLENLLPKWLCNCINSQNQRTQKNPSEVIAYVEIINCDRKQVTNGTCFCVSRAKLFMRSTITLFHIRSLSRRFRANASMYTVNTSGVASSVAVKIKRVGITSNPNSTNAVRSIGYIM